ncbi:MAG TPA: 6-phosphogluconolactonase, partial [Mycobacteriales bacterium]|nr:6-phosphogluconolactonase [Mycobacteriales bacterium]
MTAPAPDVVVEPDAEHLARAAAEALVARLAAAQAVHGSASVVLTGGGVGIAVLEQVAALAEEPVRETIDWEHIDVWWGDERFVPADSDERNEKQARAALLGRVGVPEHRIHAMPASDGEFAEPEDAAAWYAGELAAAAADGHDVPRLDVLLLWMGPEGHV